MSQGIIWIGTTLKEDSALSEDRFNKWYNEVHLTDVVNTGVADFARRFKNLDPSRPFQYLVLYNAADINSTNKFMEVPTKHELLDGQDAVHEIHLDARGYQLVQRVEGPPKRRSKSLVGLVTTCVDPDEDIEDEFNDWFNKQHLDMASMASGFIRGTRYKLADDNAFNAPGPLGPRPKYATLYEYDTTKFPAEELAILSQTEWSKRILPRLTRIERDTWVAITDPVTVPGSTSQKKFGVY